MSAKRIFLTDTFLFRKITLGSLKWSLRAVKYCVPRGLAGQQRLHARRQGATADQEDVRPGDPEGDGARRNPGRVRGRATGSVGRGDASDRTDVDAVKTEKEVEEQKSLIMHQPQSWFCR